MSVELRDQTSVKLDEDGWSRNGNCDSSRTHGACLLFFTNYFAVTETCIGIAISKISVPLYTAACSGASTLKGIQPCSAGPPRRSALISLGCIQKKTSIVPNMSAASKIIQRIQVFLPGQRHSHHLSGRMTRHTTMKHHSQHHKKAEKEQLKH
ncbi:hypothetical protein KCU76_g90, partial [Aureobasidium melanogenum]